MTTLRPTLILVLATIGCSSSSNTPADGGAMVTGMGDYLPLKVGNNWNYKVTDADGTVSHKVQAVVEEVLVGGTGPDAGKMAFKVVTGKEVNDPEGDVSYQGVVDGRVVRYRELSVDGKTGYLKNETYWSPPRLRLDQTAEHTAMSASWKEPDYTEYKIDTDRDDAGVSFVPDGGTKDSTGNDLWTVVSPSQKVTVLGAMYDALQLRRVSSHPNSPAYETKSYWFAKGIGKILETEEGKSKEELDSYRILP